MWDTSQWNTNSRRPPHKAGQANNRFTISSLRPQPGPGKYSRTLADQIIPRGFSYFHLDRNIYPQCVYLRFIPPKKPHTLSRNNCDYKLLLPDSDYWKYFPFRFGRVGVKNLRLAAEISYFPHPSPAAIISIRLPI